MSRETIFETQKCVVWAEEGFKPSDKPSIDPRSFEALSKLRYWKGELKNPKDTVLIEVAMVDAVRAGITDKKAVISLVQNKYPNYNRSKIEKRYVPNMINLLVRLFNVALRLGSHQVGNQIGNNSQTPGKRRGNKNAIFPANNSGAIGAARQNIFMNAVRLLIGEQAIVEDVSGTSCHYDVRIRSVQ